MKLYFSVVMFILTTLPNSLLAEQLTFATAEKAAETLYQGIETQDKSIQKLFSTENTSLLAFNDVNEEDKQHFISAWKKSHKISTEDNIHHYIEVGDNHWTFPVPLIKNNESWLFDTISGAENIKIRRIGRNELSTIQTVLAYYDAQLEYAERIRNDNKIIQYAQKIISTSDKYDGLYWPTDIDETPSPLGSLLANTTPMTAYHGYYYKILTSQGNYAGEGALDYIVAGNMTNGFALIAWPAIYGESGITSFMINHKGVVYEKDLGATTKEDVALIMQFNPDPSWRKSQ